MDKRKKRRNIGSCKYWRLEVLFVIEVLFIIGISLIFGLSTDPTTTSNIYNGNIIEIILDYM